MELRTASARGCDANCRGSVLNQLSGRRTRPTDLRRVGIKRTLKSVFGPVLLQKHWYSLLTLTISLPLRSLNVAAQAAAPSQASARHARFSPASASLSQSPVEATQSIPPQQVLPTVSAEESGSRQQPAQQVQEAYNLETFLKERDACGVRLQSFACKFHW